MPAVTDDRYDAVRRIVAAAQPLGSPLVHWVRPELVVEVAFLTWTHDGLLRQVVYDGVREDKPARKVQRDRPTL